MARWLTVLASLALIGAAACVDRGWRPAAGEPVIDITLPAPMQHCFDDQGGRPDDCGASYPCGFYADAFLTVAREGEVLKLSAAEFNSFLFTMEGEEGVEPKPPRIETSLGPTPSAAIARLPQLLRTLDSDRPISDSCALLRLDQDLTVIEVVEIHQALKSTGLRRLEFFPDVTDDPRRSGRITVPTAAAAEELAVQFEALAREIGVEFRRYESFGDGCWVTEFRSDNSFLSISDEMVSGAWNEPICDPTAIGFHGWLTLGDDGRASTETAMDARMASLESAVKRVEGATITVSRP